MLRALRAVPKCFLAFQFRASNGSQTTHNHSPHLQQMAVLFCSLVGFPVAILIHVILWRTFRPANPSRLIPVSGAIALPAAFLLTFICFKGLSLAESIECFALSGGLLFAYLLSMPVIESDSPSFLITMLVDTRGTKGASFDEIAKIVTDERFVLHRLRSLESDGLVRHGPHGYEATKAGHAFLQFYTAYRQLAGRSGKGG